MAFSSIRPALRPRPAPGFKFPPARSVRRRQKAKMRQPLPGGTVERIPPARERLKMTDILELLDVKKSYDGFVAVSGVSFGVPRGSIFGLLGPNGAGKTTTIRMILDILAPDSGEIRLFGRPRQAEDLARLGYLPEERGLYRKMTMVDQLLFLAEIRGLKRRAALAEIDPWLERTDLAPWAKRRIEELSKGM